MRSFNRLAESCIKKAMDRYGASGMEQGAWYHMSDDQRKDAILACVAETILAQDDTVAETSTLADAQKLIQLAVDTYTAMED